MVVTRTSASNSGQSSQAPASPPKSTRKVKKGRPAKGKVVKTTSINHIQQGPSTSGHSNVSTASLPSLQSFSGFGSVSQNSTLMSGNVAQAAKVVDNILAPTIFSGNVDQWPHYSRTVRDYIRKSLGRRDIDLMSEVGYDEETEADIYSCLCKTMDWKAFNKIDSQDNDQGTRAFQFLDTHYRRTRQMRHIDVYSV